MHNIDLTLLFAADKRWQAADAKVRRTSEARSSLPPGTSRARITTANARWTIACEARRRIEREIEDTRKVGA